MIKAVIFDCYGVLVTDGWHPFKDRHFKDNSEKDAEASRLIDLATKGKLKYGDFLRMVGDLADVNAADVEEEISHNAPNITLFELIDELKVDYKIGMLSNAAENRLEQLFTPEQVSVFDGVVLSCDIQANKPDRMAYEAIAAKLACGVSECMFVDDIASYAQAARDSGMKAVHYKDPKQAIAEIRDSLV